jgi:GntR family transcriptional regulator
VPVHSTALLTDIRHPSTPMSRIAAKSEDDKFARYQQILNILQARIASGAYPVGSQAPTEAELCLEFSVSRYTVREALRRLTELGLVSRRQGSGTIVERSEAQSGHSFALRSLTELFQYALDTSFNVVAIDTVMLTAGIAAQVGGAEGETWSRITGLRSPHPGEAPFSYVRAYVPERLSWITPELPDCVGPFYAHVEQRTKEPIVKAEQEISAVAMPAEAAAALGCPDGSFALLMLRRYVSRRGTLVASFNWHVASDFTYRMALQRDDRS